jgi:hypothetical protein
MSMTVEQSTRVIDAAMVKKAEELRTPFSIVVLDEAAS